MTLLDELAACLRKYQARYHGAPHAQKDWEQADEVLKRYEAERAKTPDPDRLTSESHN